MSNPQPQASFIGPVLAFEFDMFGVYKLDYFISYKVRLASWSAQDNKTI